MLLLIDFNTSYVKVQRTRIGESYGFDLYFNTSYVKVQLWQNLQGR